MKRRTHPQDVLDDFEKMMETIKPYIKTTQIERYRLGGEYIPSELLPIISPPSDISSK